MMGWREKLEFGPYVVMVASVPVILANLFVFSWQVRGWRGWVASKAKRIALVDLAIFVVAFVLLWVFGFSE